MLSLFLSLLGIRDAQRPTLTEPLTLIMMMIGSASGSKERENESVGRDQKCDNRDQKITFITSY